MPDETPCPNCGQVYGIGDWPWCPHGSLRRRRASLDPIVYFERADGNISIPGDPATPTPDGYIRHEITDLQGAEKFEREYRGRLSAEGAEYVEKQRESFARFRSRSREELREAMQHMTPQERQFAEAAMAHTDSKVRENAARWAENRDSTWHFDILHHDFSNREAYRSERTGWRSRKD